jgi:hypothetical protein
MTAICRNVRKFAPKKVKNHSMRRLFQVLSAWIVATCLTTSCLSNSNEVTLYDDMAVTSFTLGTLNRYLHTTSDSGTDSVYKTTFAGSSYVMYIDQVGRKIFNRDSLPVGTDISRVICTIITRNNGVALLKSMTSDSLSYYNSTDSIDFSKPRILRVYSSDGMGFSDYEVTLNVRKVEAGTFHWMQQSESELPATYTSNWQFKLNETGDGIYSSIDDGLTWTAGTYDTDTKLLPTANASFACWRLNNGMDYALLVGDNAVQDSAVVVWRKLIDDVKSTDWVYMPLAEGNNYYLPKGRFYWLLPFRDASVLAIDEVGTIYQSRDQGITWKTEPQMVCPTGLTGVAAASTDGVDEVWLKDATTGVVWYGIMTE